MFTSWIIWNESKNTDPENYFLLTILQKKKKKYEIELGTEVKSAFSIKIVSVNKIIKQTINKTY